MIPKVFQEVIDLGDGRSITIETGKLAKQADGSVNYQIKEYPFIPLLVKAFQESNEKIMRLEHEVAILKSKGETIC